VVFDVSCALMSIDGVFWVVLCVFNDFWYCFNDIQALGILY